MHVWMTDKESRKPALRAACACVCVCISVSDCVCDGPTQVNYKQGQTSRHDPCSLQTSRLTSTSPRPLSSHHPRRLQHAHVQQHPLFLFKKGWSFDQQACLVNNLTHLKLSPQIKRRRTNTMCTYSTSGSCCVRKQHVCIVCVCVLIHCSDRNSFHMGEVCKLPV